jgi:hypothetical protein
MPSKNCTQNNERRKKMKTRGSGRELGFRKSFLFLICTLFLISSCAIPVRKEAKIDESLPIGSVWGDTFVGERFPFKVEIPAGWEASTKYPAFLLNQGYGREGLEATPFFLFNPRTKSSLQIDFVPAATTARFNQKTMESLTRSVGQGLAAEVHQEHGKGTPVELSNVVPVKLKGVPYAARMSANLSIKGEPREQGWIYAFAEPYQIFILYLVTGENPKADRETLDHALSTFEYLGR